MIPKRYVIWLLAAASAGALLGCSAILRPPQAGSAPSAASSENADLPGIYSDMRREGGKVFTLAPQESVVRIYAFRAGRAGRLGHNHVLSAPQFTGFFYLPPSGPASSRFDLVFRLDQLE